jgi:iron complex transport system ATP-binding protein
MTLKTHQLTIKTPSKTICQPLNLTINPGEIWGILGANGSGKSTLLQALAGLSTETYPDIYWQGRALHTYSPRARAAQIAFLFQDTHLTFAQTVWDFCALARFPHHRFFNKLSALDESIVNESLQKTALLAFKHRSVLTLSGGEKRRLALAAVFAQTPQLFLMDEPCNHLDLHFQQQLFAEIKKAAANQAAIMMSLHDVNQVAAHCDHVLMLFPDGTHRQGLTENLLTETALSLLYQHPFKKISYENKAFWMPFDTLN